MSTFSIDQFQNAVNSTQKASSTKVGYFKLANDGDEAIVRLNVSSLQDLIFATIHTITLGKDKFLKVCCSKPVGSTVDNCELCAASATNTAISKALNKVYIQTLVSYKDKATGQYSAPVPVIWERPAGFYKDIATKLKDVHDLRNVLLKVTRKGVAKDAKTTYILDFALPAIYKPEMIPEDFSAFENFKISKHSFYEKTPEEIHTFLTTGSFPEVVKTDVDTVVSNVVKSTVEVQAQPAYTTPAQPRNSYFEDFASSQQPAAPVQSTVVNNISYQANQPTNQAPVATPAENKSSDSGFNFGNW